ncbi:hypothetical protein MKW98_027406, partial [Papaver atlanticum]
GFSRKLVKILKKSHRSIPKKRKGLKHFSQDAFEILFVLFFLIAFIIFKDLTSRPEYNQILVKKPGGSDFWGN